MTSCHEMRQGDVYYCEECGLELQVIKECSDAETGTCACEASEEPCNFECCGKDLKKK